MLFESIYSNMGSPDISVLFNEIHVNIIVLTPHTLSHWRMRWRISSVLPRIGGKPLRFVVCLGSEDERIRYSAYLSTILYVINDAQYFFRMW